MKMNIQIADTIQLKKRKIKKKDPHAARNYYRKTAKRIRE